jgi:hypothetical protein
MIAVMAMMMVRTATPSRRAHLARDAAFVESWVAFVYRLLWYGSLSGGVFVSGTLTTLSAARLLTLQDNQRVMANIGSAASIGRRSLLAGV